MKWLGVLTLCAAPLAAHAQAKELTDLEKQIVAAAVSKDFNDPEAAKFRWLPWGGSDSYCGEVNGKNTYGAYAGYRRFVARLILNADGSIKEAKLASLIEPTADDKDGSVFRAVHDACLVYSK